MNRRESLLFSFVVSTSLYLCHGLNLSLPMCHNCWLGDGDSKIKLFWAFLRSSRCLGNGDVPVVRLSDGIWVSLNNKNQFILVIN